MLLINRSQSEVHTYVNSAKFLTLTELLGSRLFRIPQYQRAYSWERKHREDMFEDIRALERDEERTHFMATVVGLYREKRTIVTDEYSVIEVVDGQQRLTTLVILLKAIEKNLDHSQPSHRKLAREIQELLVKPDDLSLILLQMNHDSGGYFRDYLREGKEVSPAEGKTLAERALLNGISDCESFVGSWNDPIRLTNIIKNRLTFIFHEINDEATVYTVFEVLNSRGLPVPWLDRLKSMLMAIAFEHSGGNKGEIIEELHRLWANVYSTIGLGL